MRVWLSTVMLLCLLSTAWAEDDWQYILGPGDSLWKVYQQFAQSPQTCWGELSRYNGLDSPYSLRPGDTLKLSISWLKKKPIPDTVGAITDGVMLYPAKGSEPRQLNNIDAPALEVSALQERWQAVNVLPTPPPEFAPKSRCQEKNYTGIYGLSGGAPRCCWPGNSCALV